MTNSSRLLHFTALLSGDEGGPVCHLLQLDGFSALIGCGWDENFNLEQLEPVLSRLHDIDAVLLSHADPCHLGALPYLVGKCGLEAHVYSTLPVRKMGEMFMAELCQAKQAISEFLVYSMEDVRRAFVDHPWTQLRYSQHLKITEGKMAGVSLTPFNAGHMVGGAVWKIGLRDGSEVLYAVDWCHRKERHLNGATITELSTRPALMVAGAAGFLAPAFNPTSRDAQLLEVIIATLRGGGSVLLPVDAAGRMLEVALLLDEFWAQEKLPYPLVCLSHTCVSVFERAQQQIEWMSDHICATFGAKRDNPFKMRCLQALTSTEKLAHLDAGPKVVLACSPTLECGFARELLLQWGEDPKNTVCFVDYAQKGSLADTLQGLAVGAAPPVVDVQRSQRVPLTGPELEAHMRSLGQAVEVVQEEEPEEEDEEEDEAGPSGAAGPAEVPGPSGQQQQGDGLVKQEQQQQQQPGPQEAQELAAESPRAANTPSASALRSARSGGFGSGRLVAMGSVPMDEDGAAGPSAGAEADVLLEGFQAPEGTSFPMFPDEDEPMLEAWDAYGIVGPPPGSTLALQASADMSLSDAMDAAAAAAAAATVAPPEEEEEEEPEVPTKLVTETVQLTLRAAIRFFDFSGRPNRAILQTVLPEVAPRHLLLVRGTAAERASLARHCESQLSDFRTTVECPSGGNQGQPAPAVEVPLPPCHTLFLSDALNASVRLQRMQRYALAQLDGVVGPPDPHHPTMLQLLPSPAEPDGEDVFIADSLNGIKLTFIKNALADAGLESSWAQGGARIVCGQVAIRKGPNDKAHLVLEGALCPDFYRVREVIYGAFSVC